MNRATINLGRAGRLLQRLRRAAVAAGRRLRAGARVPRRLRRAELEGCVAAARACRTTCSATARPPSRPTSAASRWRSGVTNFTRLANPMSTTVNSVSRTWTDLNGNFAPDCDLTSPLANAECGQMQNLNFGKSVPVDALRQRRVRRLRRARLQLGGLGEHPARACQRPLGQRVLQPALVRQLPRRRTCWCPTPTSRPTASPCRSIPACRAAAATSCAASTTSARRSSA